MSFTLSKKDLSSVVGSGAKFSSSNMLSKNVFWSFVRFCGVQTFTCTNKSPVPYPSKLGNPLPRKRNILPDCVPASNLIFTFPFTVSISLEAVSYTHLTLPTTPYV